MNNHPFSRRGFLSASAAGTWGVQLASAAQVKPADLPNLTIKEVRVYETSAGRLAGVVTESGIEGNYTLGTRYWHPNWENTNWHDFAKRLLVGKITV